MVDVEPLARLDVAGFTLPEEWHVSTVTIPGQFHEVGSEQKRFIELL